MKHTIPTILLFLVCFTGLCQERVLLPAGTVSTVVHHKGYTVSFNDDARIPNYVCYTLRPEDITTEGVSRTGEEFLPDPDIPGCPESRDYSRTGYDRGHMMPAADCKTSEVRMTESFYLSNVCPQDHTLNEKDWCDLEKQVRFWCKHYFKTDIRVVCGPLFNDKSPRTASGIVIPEGFFKVVCRKDSRSGKWQSVGFIFKNTSDSQPYHQMTVTVDEIETITGMDFFTDIPDVEESQMEKEKGYWKF